MDTLDPTLLGRIQVLLTFTNSSTSAQRRWWGDEMCFLVWEIFKAEVADLHLITSLVLLQTDYRTARRPGQKQVTAVNVPLTFISSPVSSHLL